MNNIWLISIDDYITIMEEAIILGKERGKKEGDNPDKEFFEIAEKKGMLNKVKKLGATELNKEELKEQYKMKGLNILDLTKEDPKGD
jgi:hypothetical protein